MTRNAITPPPYKTDNQLVADKGDEMKKFSIIEKITFALAAIVIAAVSLFLTSLLSGCDSAGYAAAPVEGGCAPVTDADCEQALTECLDDITAPKNVTVDTDLQKQLYDAQSVSAGLYAEKTDCEQRLNDEQEYSMNMYYHAEDALDVISSHLDVVALCDAGEIKVEWLCKAAYDGNL